MEDAVLLIRLGREEMEARDQLRAARERFNQILADTPSGIPHHHGSERIQRAGAEVRFWNHRSAEATRRIMDYLVSGKVPEEYADP
jgi:hypothetical protein